MFKPYKYVKKQESFIKRFKKKKKHLYLYESLHRIFSFLIFSVGFVVLAVKVVFPVVSSYANSNNREPVINPFNSAIISTSPVESSSAFTFSELTEQAEKHINLESEDIVERVSVKPENFYLSIPKLKIFDAIVEVDADSLDPKEFIGHFKGSCLPGDGCNTFVYGHSTFKYVKNKYKEGDYSGVFSNLDELTYGDEFSIRYNGEVLNYLVDFTRVQEPSEVDPLGSPYPKSIGKHESTVELFTCTPAGTTKYRLSVVGKLVK